MAKVTRADLIKTANDLCEKLELEDSKGGPAIPTTKTTKTSTIQSGIIEAAGYIEEEDLQDLEVETKDTLKSLECMPSFGKEEPEDEPLEESEEDADEPEDEEDDSEEEQDEEDEPEEEPEPEEEVEPPSLLDVLKSTKKLADLKELVEKEDTFKTLRKGLSKFKGLQGPRQLKPKMVALLKKQRKAEEPKQEEVKSEKKKAPEKKAAAWLTRYQAVFNFIKEKKVFTMKEAIMGSDALFVAAGGNSNTKATNVVRYIMQGLVAFKVLSLKDGTYTLNAKYNK